MKVFFHKTFAVFFLFLSANTFADNTAVLKIWLSKKLNLSSLSLLEGNLSRPFDDPFIVHLKTSLSPETQSTTVRSCADYLKVRDKILGSEPEQDFDALKYAGATCLILDMLHHAKSAKTSFIPESVFDKVTTLPAGLAIAVSPEDIAHQRQAETKKMSLKQYDKLVSLKTTSNETSKIIGRGWSADFTVYAKGDFDDDGIEDVLVRRDGQLSSGSYTIHDVFLLSKKNKGDIYQLTKHLY